MHVGGFTELMNGGVHFLLKDFESGLFYRARSAGEAGSTFFLQDSGAL